MRRRAPTTTNRHHAPAEDGERVDELKSRDSATEAVIKEAAEILAKGYVRLLEKRRQAGAAGVTTTASGIPHHPRPERTARGLAAIPHNRALLRPGEPRYRQPVTSN
jgi:hypothetical protein